MLILKYILIGLLCVLPSVVLGQVAHDVTSAASGLSVSHTRGAISNPYALACVTSRNAALDFTAVSYGGVAMTQLAEQTAANQRAELWGLINPASGAQPVTATGGDNNNTIIVSTFSGVHQTIPTGTVQSVNTSGGFGESLNITVSTDGLGVDCLGHGLVETLVVGAGQTERAEQSSDDSTSAVSTEGSTGTVTMSYSWATEHYTAYIAIPLEPAAIVGASTRVPTAIFVE